MTPLPPDLFSSPSRSLSVSSRFFPVSIRSLSVSIRSLSVSIRSLSVSIRASSLRPRPSLFTPPPKPLYAPVQASFRCRRRAVPRRGQWPVAGCGLRAATCVSRLTDRHPLRQSFPSGLQVASLCGTPSRQAAGPLRQPSAGCFLRQPFPAYRVSCLRFSM